MIAAAGALVAGAFPAQAAPTGPVGVLRTMVKSGLGVRDPAALAALLKRTGEVIFGQLRTISRWFAAIHPTPRNYNPVTVPSGLLRSWCLLVGFLFNGLPYEPDHLGRKATAWVYAHSSVFGSKRIIALEAGPVDKRPVYSAIIGRAEDIPVSALSIRLPQS
ncbi:hypothetical protein [Nonomuraea endophytica]|uniref:hypothetical protein n=1 Tax=Nonomuraea endophytica TaxID=714136 RepID=UPI0037CBB587